MVEEVPKELASNELVQVETAAMLDYIMQL